jgi:hypothetical protein
MAVTQGGFSISVSGGVPTATAVGQVPQDGTYVINVMIDDTGVSLGLVTPYGAIGQDDIQKGDASN